MGWLTLRVGGATSFARLRQDLPGPGRGLDNSLCQGRSGVCGVGLRGINRPEVG